VLAVMAVTWCNWLERDLMPRGDFAHAHMRLRLVFATLARYDVDLALLMEELVAREHAIIARRLVPDSQQPEELAVEMIHALVVSLWSRQCRPISPVSNEDARTRLREYMDTCRRPRSTCSAGGSTPPVHGTDVPRVTFGG
jgi:hypothetical protein